MYPTILKEYDMHANQNITLSFKAKSGIILRWRFFQHLSTQNKLKKHYNVCKNYNNLKKSSTTKIKKHTLHNVYLILQKLN